ncbi:membrane protein insertion efficiency factor YidD [Moraxella sp. ZJ142]|uniref:membrane protein insertion efficiency factor YidD n=1 Tax=Moraxella marmotae TaxID=3344520 RepID=UPI0035D4162B
MIKNLILLIIRCYQQYISPMLSPRCRYYPTCSTYGKQAIIWHGVGRGLPLLLCRIGRCHPWGGSGIDFVPLPLYRYHYTPACVAFALPYRDRQSYVSRLNHLMANS